MDLADKIYHAFDCGFSYKLHVAPSTGTHNENPFSKREFEAAWCMGFVAAGFALQATQNRQEINNLKYVIKSSDGFLMATPQGTTRVDITRTPVTAEEFDSAAKQNPENCAFFG